VEGDSKQACGRCDQVDELLCIVAELQEEVSRLRSIQESKKHIDQSCAQPPLMHANQLRVATMEAGPGSILYQERGSIRRDRQGWKKVTAQSCKRNSSLSSQSKADQKRVQGPRKNAKNLRSTSSDFLILPVMGRDFGRNRRAENTNSWLQD